jgi:hypothetical protein
MKVKHNAMWLAGALLLLAASAAQATVLVIDFEGLADFESVDEYYNGGFGGDGSGPGLDWGIGFSNSLAIKSIETGFSGNFTNAPSGNTILFFRSGTASTMNVADGFSTGFSFFYTSINQSGSVNVWDGLNGTGNLLASLELTALGGCQHPRAFCNWAPVGVAFDGIARSVEFGGVADFIGFDDITLGSEFAGGVPVPAPGAVGLIALAVCATALTRRRRVREAHLGTA